MGARWSVPLEQLAKRANLDLERIIKMSTLYIFGQVVYRSPVDTGRFRANWVCTYNRIAEGFTRDTTDKKGDRTVNTIENQINRFPVGGVMWLSNSLPYAMTLEYGGYPNPPKMGSKKRGEAGIAVHVQGGYSMQAPQGMVRITAREFADAVQERIK
jgi:hypothetical protein